jgi:cytochrome c oxidase subunit 3
MARAVVKDELVEAPRLRRFTIIHGSGGGPPAATAAVPAIPNAQLGVLVFVAFEAMVFAGLITAYLVLRAGSFVWVPPELPRLPLAVSWINTAMLLASAVTMQRAVGAIRGGRYEGLKAALLATLILGAGFLAVQGAEWVRLVHRGLTMSSSLYGATFYTLIGLHALHVVGAVAWLTGVYWLARRGRFSATHHLGIDVCATYWYFVCALWVVLFWLVYLS